MFSRGTLYELLCISTMGFGQMFMMTGYNTQSFVAESVLHSIHSRAPEVIDTYAGYYGYALLLSLCYPPFQTVRHVPRLHFL